MFKKLCAVVAVACSVGLGAGASAQGWVQIADSVTDFSSTQGQNGWWYGYAISFGEPATVTMMANYTAAQSCGCGNVGAIWHFAPGVCFCSQEFCFQGATGAHPDGHGEPHVPVRRYVLPASGRYLLQPSFSHGGGCQAAEDIRLELRFRGAVIWSASTDGGAQTGSIEIVGNAGEFVELWSVMLLNECGTYHEVSMRVSKVIATRYVPTEYATIQSAINASASFDTVQVAAGTYAGPIDFMGKNIVVRGAGAANTIIQGTGGTNTSVVSFNGEPQSAAIEGVTIRGGLTGTLYPNTPPQYLLGGGIFMLNSACSIRNCIIESNIAGFGGGAYALGCTGTISNCIFRNNNASADGGGIQLFGGAPKVVDTVVENNFANSRGAGMHVVQGTPELLRVNIRNNVSNNIVGGLSWYGLGSPSAFLKVTSCQVTSNSALVVQGGIGISSTSQANISILDSVACANLPLPNISGVWENLGGNSVCKCIGDIVENGSVDGGDLAVLISQMQTSGGVPSADIDESGFVDGIDLAFLLSAWGACPSNGSITSITPAVGPTSGGTAITITGIGLINMTSVKFGGVAATNVVATSTTVTAVTPARAAGVVDVAVSGQGQYVVATSAFTYSSTVVPAWATLLEAAPNPTVVTNANLRAAIVASGFAWRIRDTSSNIEMLLVPAGTFTMGCSASNSYACDSDENPLHQVTLTQAFYMGRYEVTQAQWTAKMGSNPSYFVGYSDSALRPVERVTWTMVASGSTSFMSLTGLRLPTEAEWEYAYRAGTTMAFHSYPAQPTGFNDDTLLGNIAWYSSNAGSQTHAVGGKLANGLGLHDMSGNVWELVQDWDAVYPSGSVTNPTGPATGTERLWRGGSVWHPSAPSRGSNRESYPPASTFNDLGFRAARTP